MSTLPAIIPPVTGAAPRPAPADAAAPSPPAPAPSQQVVADKWSVTEYEYEKTYFGFPGFRDYRIRTAFGPESVDRYKDVPHWPQALFLERYLAGRKVESVLSLCCGFGHVERFFVQNLGSVRHCLALDIAPGAIQTARRRAAETGVADRITYEVADLNRYDGWGTRAYDLVIANGALHHLSNLEGVLAGIRGALKPGGILYCNETVGPSYQDHPPRQVELINAMAYLVPPDLRLRGAAGSAAGAPDGLSKAVGLLAGTLYVPDPSEKPGWSAPKRAAAKVVRTVFPSTRRRRTPFGLLHDSKKEFFLKTDPSEGVRSAEIIPLVKQSFPQVEIHPTGGALLAYALDQRFYRNYRPEDPRHRALVKMLCAIEEHFTAAGELPPEHAILIANA